jgi:hypothetical protein
MRVHLGEPARLQLVVELVQPEGIDTGPEAAPEDIDVKRTTARGATVLSCEAAPKNRVDDLLERNNFIPWK